jgi:DNA primase
VFAGRFVIPLHDETGQLVGYAARSLDGREPKYLFPDSAKHHFHKRFLLFNLHRVKETAPAGPVVVVEGLFDCMRVTEAGLPCVGILGSALSAEQEELLCKHFRQVVLCFDGDSAGRIATEDCVKRLVPRLFVKAVYLPDGKQPDMLTADEISRLIKGGIS